MKTVVVERTTIFVISLIVFVAVYKGAKKSVEISFLWAAGALLLLRLLLWRGYNQWMQPIYRATGATQVEKFQGKSVDFMDNITKMGLPLTKKQKQELEKMKEEFRNLSMS